MPMDEANKAEQAGESLRVGLIADAEGVALLGPALADVAVEVIAQGGMPQADALADVQWFDDARVMATQPGVEALILAASPRAAVDLEHMTTSQAMPVWRMPPLARNFAEATELVTRMRERGALYRVASWWNAVADDVHWAMRCEDGFKPIFSNVRVGAAGPSLQSWRSSLADSPGGVLATDAYGMLEALIAVRGLPERVYAGVTKVRRKPGEAQRETEDVATAILHYESGATACLQTIWDVHPFEQATEHHGAQRTVTLEPGRVAILDRDGQVLDERGLRADAFLHQELSHFVAAVRNPPATGGAPDAAIERHVAVTAMLQAIYLSARTGQPESPHKLYEVQGWPKPRW